MNLMAHTPSDYQNDTRGEPMALEITSVTRYPRGAYYLSVIGDVRKVSLESIHRLRSLLEKANRPLL